MEAWITERAKELNRYQDENPGICVITRDPPRMETHPLIIGVLKWLRAQAQRYVDREEPYWRGARAEFGRLLEGTHHDPQPGLIITPDAPDSFHVDQILARGFGYKGQEQWIKNELRRISSHVDSSAYFTVCEMVKVPLTPELDALQCIHELDIFIADHLEIAEQPPIPENFIPTGLAIRLERARLRGHDISDIIAGTNLDPAVNSEATETTDFQEETADAQEYEKHPSKVLVRS